MTHPITLEQELPHTAGLPVFIARDEQRRSFVGVRRRHDDGERFLFVQIDRVTQLELERGQVDLHTVIDERCAGIVFEADQHEVSLPKEGLRLLMNAIPANG